METIKHNKFRIGIGLAIILGICFSFVPFNADSYSFGGGKITCHSSAQTTAGYEYTKCSTCTSSTGIGSDAGQCRVN